MKQRRHRYLIRLIVMAGFMTTGLTLSFMAAESKVDTMTLVILYTSNTNGQLDACG